MVGGLKQTRVLIASPSPYMRYAITRELNPEPDLIVVGTVRTRDELARDELAHKRVLLRPDLIVVDIETSRELSDLEWTIAATDLPVLALCAHSQDGAALAFAALEAGAADVVAHSNAGAGIEFTPDMVDKARGVARVRSRPAVWCWPAREPRPKNSPRAFVPGDCLIVVTASTGSLGPFSRFLMALPAELEAAVLVLSHLPQVYVDWLLDRFEPALALHLHRACDGMPLRSGAVYFSPCDCQLLVGPGDSLTSTWGAFSQGACPSVDLTLSSLAARYGSAVLGVILSGIGRAGVQGARDVRANGGEVIVQEPETCLAGETPQAVIESGAATAVLPPERIAEEIVRRVAGGCRVAQLSVRSR